MLHTERLAMRHCGQSWHSTVQHVTVDHSRYIVAQHGVAADHSKHSMVQRAAADHSRHSTTGLCQLEALGGQGRLLWAGEQEVGDVPPAIILAHHAAADHCSQAVSGARSVSTAVQCTQLLSGPCSTACRHIWGGGAR